VASRSSSKCDSGDYGSLRSQDDVRWEHVFDSRDHHPESCSGLLMGLLYGLIAWGWRSLGLMDVVNFAHGEFLMIAMYATFFCSRSLPSIRCWQPAGRGGTVCIWAVVYLLIVRFAVGESNAGMCRFFRRLDSPSSCAASHSTSHPDYRSITHSWLGGKTVSSPHLLTRAATRCALVSIAAFGALYFFINRTDFGLPLNDP